MTLRRSREGITIQVNAVHLKTLRFERRDPLEVEALLATPGN
jgi:hypothetical protein